MDAFDRRAFIAKAGYQGGAAHKPRAPPGPCPLCKQRGHWKSDCPTTNNASASAPPARPAAGAKPAVPSWERPGLVRQAVRQAGDGTDGVIVIDGNGKIEQVNSVAARLLGATRESLDGRPCTEVLGLSTMLKEGVHDCLAQHKPVLLAEPLSLLVDPPCTVRVSIGPVLASSPKSRGAVLVLSDVTALVIAEAQLHHQATHDPLTGLPNRTLIQDRLQQLLAASQRRGDGVGLGLSSVSPWSFDGISAASFGVSTIVWLTLTSLLSSAMGGYLTGRLRTKWMDTQTDEVYFRDSAHGFLAWAVASLATAALLTSAIGSILGGGIQAGASVVGGVANTASVAASGLTATGKMAAEESGPMAYFVDSLFRREGSAEAAGLASATGSAMPGEASERSMTRDAAEVGRIFMNVSRSESLPPTDLRLSLIHI